MHHASPSEIVSRSTLKVVYCVATLSIVIGAFTGGLVVGRLGRYQAVAIVAAIILGIGVFLLSRLDSSTTLLIAGVYMVITGIGLGVFMPMMSLVG